MKLSGLCLLIPNALLLLACKPSEPELAKTPLWELQEAQGLELPNHTLGRDASAKQREAGKTLFFSGRDLENAQSVYFNCIDCHRVSREDPLLSDPDPEQRLAAALPKQARGSLLPGSSMHGVVNREHFYNGVYQKKYGGLVQRASKDLVEAVQVCAEFCSQGRRYDEAELEAMMAYLWSLQLTLGDLLSPEELASLSKLDAPLESKVLRPESLNARYLKASPASEYVPPETPLVGNPQRGKAVFEQSCVSCHQADRNSPMYELDIQRLHQGFENGKILDVVRKGIDPDPGRKDDYMPYYTPERLSEQQYADMQAYIAKEANK